MRPQGIGNLAHVPRHDRIQAVQGQADAVIGHAPLGEVVGADTFRTVAGTDLLLAVGGKFGILLLDDVVHDAGLEDLHGLGPVLDLAAFLLAGDYRTGGEVGDAHGRVGGVDVLAAGAG